MDCRSKEFTVRWIRRLSAITQLSLNDRGRNGGKEMDLRGTGEKAWTKPGAQVGVGSLARSYQNLSSEGNGVREGALCQEQGWSQSLELKPICPGGMSPLSRRPGLLDSPPSQDPLSPDPGACRWGPTGPSYEERGVRGQGTYPSDNRRPELREPPTSAMAIAASSNAGSRADHCSLWATSGSRMGPRASQDLSWPLSGA